MEAGVEALPVAEIAFVDFPAGVPPLVGYEAKWATGSFEETPHVRRFPGEEHAALLAEIRTLALAAWSACGLSGYGRVDLRLDEAGQPVILEVNANPCLSSDAGFMAAARPRGASGCRRRADESCRAPAAVMRTGAVLGWWLPSAGGRVNIRTDLRPEDRAPLEELLRATGFFNPQGAAGRPRGRSTNASPAGR